MSREFASLIAKGGRPAVAIAVVLALAVGSSVQAGLLLNDTWADGSRAETNYPAESAVWVGMSSDTGGALTTSVGTLSQTVATNSMKVWTHFRPDGSEVNLGVGSKLTATLQFELKTALYSNTSRSFRIGLYNDPTDPQVQVDVNDDGGGAGDPWQDSTGYAVEIPLTSGPAVTTPFQIFKRINNNTSLLGSSSAMSSSSSGGDQITESLDTLYTLTMELKHISASEMKVKVSLADAGGLLATHVVSDDGSTFTAGTLPGSANPWTTFEHLFIRTSSNSSVADGIDYKLFRVEVVPEPASLMLLGLGGLALLAVRRRR